MGVVLKIAAGVLILPLLVGALSPSKTAQVRANYQSECCGLPPPCPPGQACAVK